MLIRRISSAWLKKVNSRIQLKRTKTYSQFELNEPQPSTLYPLHSRKLLRVTGSDASVFLQGLITNDMRHFDDGSKSMYAMFLNNKGRVLYDTLIHKSADTFLLECDKNVITLLLRHLKMFKLKRQVELGDYTNHYKVWAFTAPPEVVSEIKGAENKIQIYKDPRLENLGYRVLSHVSVEDESVQNFFGNEITVGDEIGYRKLRYQLGVSEGSHDLPPGTCFPLEANCDYLHGVSFHKGCYVGQELTARVHHTGVVRKRIMPLKISGDVIDLEEDAIIKVSDKPKSNLGKIKGIAGNFGLGLVRIKEAMEAKDLNVGKYTIKIEKPSWWPIEAPKEKIVLAD